jgi:hypothetical protein
VLDLTPEEAERAAFALESHLRIRAVNGLGMTADDPRRTLAAKLALSVPVFVADLCPAVMRTAGPDVAARCRELAAGETPQARQGKQRAVSALPELMSAREVADASGMTVQGVRQAISRGSLPAFQDQETGRWWIGRHAYEQWEARRAAVA